MDIRTIRRADVDSDHFLVKIKYRRFATRKYNIKDDAKRWNLMKLEESNTRKRFEEVLADKLRVVLMEEWKKNG